MPFSNRRRRTLVAIAAALGAPLLAGGLMSPAAAEVRPICFPVLDPVHYTISFGAPRNGGRTHEGTDLMGAKMHRLVSAVSGQIVDLRYSGSANNADNAVRIRGDDGYYYAYLHMNNDTPGTDDGMAPITQVFASGITNGARVRAGQLLGYMGDSGNAESTSPHLHFEIRRPTTPDTGVWGSVAINSYDSLRAAPICQSVNSPTHPFTPMAGTLSADPDAASSGEDLGDAFARGADNQLWQRSWANGQFGPWIPLGGILRSGPTAVAVSSTRLDVFARGVDDQLWQRTRTGTSWGQWTPLGGILSADPDATSGGDGSITLAARGVDGTIFVRTFDGTSWGDWVSSAGVSYAGSGPTVASTGPGHIAMYARGLDNRLWRRVATAGTWGSWQPFGGILTSDPDAAAAGEVVHIVARGSDNRLWAIPDQPGSAWSLVSIDAVIGGPSVVSSDPGRLDVLVTGPDHALYQTWWTGSGW